MLNPSENGFYTHETQVTKTKLNSSKPILSYILYEFYRFDLKTPDIVNFPR